MPPTGLASPFGVSHPFEEDSVSASSRKRHLPCAALALGLGASTAGQEALDVEGYVQLVLRSHPAARVEAGLEEAARAEQKAPWQFPDPSLEYSRARARPSGRSAVWATETGVSLSQTIPWPGALAADARARARAADSLHAQGTATRWEVEIAARRAFARLTTARALHDIDSATENDARSLRELVARRTDLGETRESDRIRATVEWMRQRRLVQASAREAEAAEVLVRAIAVAPLPRPLVLRADPPGDLRPQDRESLVARLLERNPQLLGARADAERQRELIAHARTSRFPDLNVTVFRDRELDKAADGIALGIELPLWNANRREIARARAALSVAAAEVERRRLDLVAELDEGLKDLDVASAQVQMLVSDILPSAAGSLQLARRSYEEGETSLLDLLDAQRTFRETQREAVESRLALALAAADIQRLVGPDFDPWR